MTSLLTNKQCSWYFDFKTTITKKYENIEVCWQEKDAYQFTMEKDPDWKYIMNIQIKNIPTGVHNITIKSKIIRTLY